MMNPERLVDDLFDDKNLSDPNLRSFSEDCLIRLSVPANNPGSIYSGLIASTTAKHTAFFGKMSDESIKKSISEGLTIATYTARDKAWELISHLQNLVKFKFGDKSPIYQEFYPLGMKEYYDARLDELPLLFERFRTAATTHLMASNPAEVTDLIAKTSAYQTARAAQQTAFAEIENLQTGRREDRKALTMQLTTNMLTIALNNLGNPDNFNNYYNPSYLPLTDKAFSVNGIIAPGAVEVAVAAGVITQSSSLSVYNNGTSDLVFSISDQPGVIHPVHQVTITPGSNERFSGTLPVFQQYYLNVQNPDAVENGKWKVKVN